MNPAPKTYQLKTAPASALSTKQRTAIFHRAKCDAELARPGLNTYALTAKLLGGFKSFKTVSEAEFWKLVNAFKGVAAKGRCQCEAAPLPEADAKQAAAELLSALSRTRPSAQPVAPVAAPPAAPLACPTPALPTPPARAQRVTPAPGASGAEALYTAAQIAAALGAWPRATRRRLGSVRTAGQLIVRGQPTSAWSLHHLPADLQTQLTEAAQRRGYRDAAHLLSEPPKEWQPAIPLRDVAEAGIERAVKLQRSLARTLELRASPLVSAAERAAMGLQDYQREFGHGITARHWRNLFQRTLDRDGGAGNFARLELYLDENPARKAATPPAGKSTDTDFAELHHVIVGFKQPAGPTKTEVDYLWQRSLELFAALAPAGADGRLKGRLLDFLWRHAPCLAKSRNALRVNFERKLQRWADTGFDPAACRDGRELRRGVAVAPEFNPDSLDKIAWHTARNCGGRLSQGVRELVEQEALDPQLLRMFLVKRANKSSVPQRLRDRVTPEIRTLLPHVLGPRAVEKNLPPLDLTYDGIHSIQCVQADDFTWPVYFWLPDGEGWFKLTRGQCILVIDFRSLRILGYALHPFEQYNSAVIRTAFTRTFDNWGLPDTLYLERGIWKSSRLIVGQSQGWDEDLPLSDGECEMGLRQFGINFIHARRARSKPVERVGGLLQDLMHGEPGYCGRDERKDCPEAVTRAKRVVENKQEHPSRHFHSFEQWEARFGELCERYNRATQDGKRLAGQSPEEALAAHWNHANPPTSFDASCRYLLAHHKVPGVEVKFRGIEFTVRGESFRYLDTQTGARIGQRLTAWFNPEAPEFCTFTDSDLRNAFTVARANSVNALNTAGEAYAVEVGKTRAHAAHAQTRYRVLKAKFKPVFRGNLVSPVTADLGAAITQQQDAAREKLNADNTRMAKARKVASRLGMRPENLRRPDQIEAAEELGRLLKEVETPEANQ